MGQADAILGEMVELDEPPEQAQLELVQALTCFWFENTQFEIEIFTCSAYLTSIEPDATIRIVQEPKKTYKAISQSKLAQLKPEEVQSAHIAVFATTPSARESTGDEKNSANQNDDFDLELGWTDAMNDDENEDRKWLRFAARNLMPVFF